MNVKPNSCSLNPTTAWAWIRFPPWVRVWHRLVFLLARCFRWWRVPTRKPQPSFLANLAWLCRSREPVLSAEPRSGLAEYFAQQPLHQVQFLPDGFNVEDNLILSAVGDLLPCRGLAASRDRLYGQIGSKLFGADIAMANFEAVLSENADKKTIAGLHEPIQMTASDLTSRTLTRHGKQQYTILHMANNHTFDLGFDGFLHTHQTLRRQGFALLGTHLHPDLRGQGMVLERRGFRLGFVAATYGVNGGQLPPGCHGLLNLEPLHEVEAAAACPTLEDQIRWCREEGCQFVVASLHWGHEFELYPRLSQVKLAHSLIEAGADAIIGHHSHMLQPFELYRMKRSPGKLAPIFYGLGNLTSLFSAPYNALSGLLRLHLVVGKREGHRSDGRRDAGHRDAGRRDADRLELALGGFELTPVLQTEIRNAGRSYLRIDYLHQLLEEPSTRSRRAYVEEAARYADLALNYGWRLNGSLSMGLNPS